MVISVDKLLSIDNIDSFNLIYNRKNPTTAAIYNISNKGIERTLIVSKEHLNTLRRKGVIKVSVCTNRTFLEFLHKKFPGELPKPDGEYSLSELFRRAEEYEIMNTKSQKKRYITVLEDIYSAEPNFRGEKELLIEYGTRLTTKVMATTKKYIDPTEKVYFMDSEKGALVFIPEPRNFPLKVDLLAILSTFDFPIYPDAKTVEEAMDIYKNKSPKIVILGNLNESLPAKKLILKLDEFDPYVKKLDYEKSPASQKDAEIKRIRTYYYSPYARILASEEEEKLPLPDELKEKLLLSLQKLQQNWSEENYIDTAFVIKQFGRMFNVKHLMHMLRNIRFRHGYHL